MKINFFVILLTASFINQDVAAQFKQPKHLADSAKMGIYTDAVQLMRNQPEIVCSGFGTEFLHNVNNQQGICLEEISYYDVDGEVKIIPTERIWAICYDGHVYIREKVPENIFFERQCLIRLLYAGSLSSFIYIQNDPGGYSQRPGGPSIPYNGKTVIHEYVVDMHSGERFHVGKNFGKIKRLITSDPDFAGLRITRSELDEAILLYNRKHKHPLLLNPVISE